METVVPVAVGTITQSVCLAPGSVGFDLPTHWNHDKNSFSRGGWGVKRRANPAFSQCGMDDPFSHSYSPAKNLFVFNALVDAIFGKYSVSCHLRPRITFQRV
jgi:hypothetical protein